MKLSMVLTLVSGHALLTLFSSQAPFVPGSFPTDTRRELFTGFHRDGPCGLAVTQTLPVVPLGLGCKQLGRI